MRISTTALRPHRLVVPENRAIAPRVYICEQAIGLFQGNGFRGTSMNDIAEACGVSKPALYHYFRSKGELLEAAYDTVTSNLWELIAEIESSTDGPEQKLRALIRAQVGYHIDNHGFLAVFWRERHELDDATRKAVRAHEERYERAVKVVLLEGQQSGTFADFDIDLACNMLLGLLSTVYRWGGRMHRSHDDLANSIAALMLSGWAAR